MRSAIRWLSAGALLLAAQAYAEGPRATLTLVTSAEPARSAEAASPDQLAGSVAARDSGDVAAAWLAEPVTSYGHNVLGDLPEAKSVIARLKSGKRLAFRLEGDAVLEDTMVRLADLDGDGEPELLVVKSRPGLGSSLLALRIRGERLEPLAETAPIGTHFRWLNPIGAADLDGDGRVELALVTTPHIGGTLRIYRLEGGALREIAQTFGFSNHALGSRALGLHAFVDTDGDGVPEIVLPSADRRAIRVMRLRAGALVELERVELPQRVDGDFAPDPDGRGLRVPLSGKRSAHLRWR